MKEIPLTQGFIALIDDEDFERVSQYKWHAMCRRRLDGSIYACARRKIKGKHQTLHSFVLNGQKSVDHRNRNALDCQKSNLRPVTPSQNQYNRVKPSHNTTGFKGVIKRRGANRWQVQITADSKRLYGGTFNTPEEAARAYDALAVKHHGEFACLNYPPPC